MNMNMIMIMIMIIIVIIIIASLEFIKVICWFIAVWKRTSTLRPLPDVQNFHWVNVYNVNMKYTRDMVVSVIFQQRMSAQSMGKFVLLMHSARSKPMDFTLASVGLVITFPQRNGRRLVKVLTSTLLSNTYPVCQNECFIASCVVTSTWTFIDLLWNQHWFLQVMIICRIWIRGFDFYLGRMTKYFKIFRTLLFLIKCFNFFYFNPLLTRKGTEK